ncbi:unnamed protein product [Rotaria socialis]|uniref:Uncharacterized protein n=1 Tax=Rotaria socialis TaxID=392032 RepID=A0A820YMG2_9BILA|nr:unnamed protein product [Rotaria socialis]
MVDMSGDDSDDDMNDGKLNDYVQYKCDHITHYDYNATWSLQDAIETTFNKFLDKSQTINFWQCGIDLQLDTWKNKLFSRPQYNKHIEQQQRIKMKQYPTDDCIAVAELFLSMYSDTTKTITTTTTKTTRRTLLDLCDDLSDISEDELIQILKPKFDKREPTLYPSYHETHTLATQPTEEEMHEFNTNEVQQIQQQQQQQSQIQTTASTKSEKQRIKNMKLKWKQKHRPDFQRKIKRPIYYKYDFRKIRAQLPSKEKSDDEELRAIAEIIEKVNDEYQLESLVTIEYLIKKRKVEMK